MTKATSGKIGGSTAKSLSVWRNFETESSTKGTPTKVASPRKKGFSWVLNAVLPLTLTIVSGVAVLLPESLTTNGRLSLFTFALAVILWSTTSFNAAFVALAVVVLLVLTGGVPQEKLYESLASDVVWLMIGAFILGAAVQQTGLAARFAQLVVSRARTVGSVLWLLTTMIIPLSFFIPSTSGRAAVVIPIFHTIANAANDKRVTKAIAILMPTVILVSTIGTIIAAGSHLVANDLLYQISKQQISFTDWMLYGTPFGIIASYISCWVIMRLFLDKSACNVPLHYPKPKRNPFPKQNGLL